MPDNEENEPLARTVLRRMGGMSNRQADQYLEQCTPEEVAALELCEDGKQFAVVTDAIADRINPPPQPKEDAPDDVEDAVEDEDEADEGDEPGEE